MAIPYEFGYEKPATIEEAVQLLERLGKSARILAGGTDLANEVKQGFRVPDVLIDIKGINSLNNIEIKDNQILVGSLVTFSDILKSKLIRDNAYILYEAAGLVASNGIRNRATMVGNICSAVACMDSAVPLLVHDAIVSILGNEGVKEMPIQDWFVDNRKTALGEHEIVTHVTIPFPKIKYAGAYQKMMRYAGEDLSQANVGVLLLADKTCRIAFGSVGPIPKRSSELESHFKNKGITPQSVAEAKEMIEGIIKPITDVRASKEYRMHMTKVMFERAMKKAAERLKQPNVIKK